MTDQRAEIVRYVRSLVGTPWLHQGRMPRVGLDCAGVLTVTTKHFGLSTFDLADYGKLPDGLEMLRLCALHMTSILVRDMQPADAICMKIERRPQHIGIVADCIHGGLSMIHADNLIGRVVETRLDARWMSKVIAAYRLPGVV